MNFERALARRLRRLGWINACRHLEPTQAEAQYQRDLNHTDPFAIQCKNLASYPPMNAYLAIAPEHPSQIPLLVANGPVPLVTLSLDDFLRMVSPQTPGRPIKDDF